MGLGRPACSDLPMLADNNNLTPPTTLDRPLLTYSEAAELLGLKIGTLYALVSAKRIPHIRLSGRLVRFEREALEKYVEERRVSAGK